VTLIVLDEPVSPWQGLLSALGTGSAASALGHHAAVRLALRHEDWFWAGPDVRGYRVQVQVQKNKLAPAGKTVSLDIRFNGTVRGDGL
jgi:RecA/RadA recombinase